MNVTLIDRIGAVVLQNGIMRVDCFAAGPNGQETPSGRLLIPATQASAILQALVGAAQELDRRLREQGQQAAAAAPAAAASAPAAAATEGSDKPARAKDKKARAEG
jgi:hypothetical protein